MNQIFLIMLYLFGLVLSSYILSNAIEHLGERFNLSQGVTGSVIAAVSTALPETIVPIIAFFGFKFRDSSLNEIGVGSVLGAPLMLSTLSLFVIGIVIAFKRGLFYSININVSDLKLDFKVFFISYIIILFGVQFYQFLITKYLLSIALIFLYLYYIYAKFKNSDKEIKEGFNITADSKLLFRINNLFIIIFQFFIGLIFLIIIAKLFIKSLSALAISLNISPYLLSLIIIPIATELPEKFNSIFWMYKGKDTMAMGNIIGAMIFQGTIIPAIALFQLNILDNYFHTLTMLLTILAVLWICICIQYTKRLEIWMIMVTIIFYIINIILSIVRW